MAHNTLQFVYTSLLLVKLEVRWPTLCYPSWKKGSLLSAKLDFKCFAFGVCFQKQFFLLARECFVVPIVSETEIPHYKHELNFPILPQWRWIVLFCCISSWGVCADALSPWHRSYPQKLSIGNLFLSVSVFSSNSPARHWSAVLVGLGFCLWASLIHHRVFYLLQPFIVEHKTKCQTHTVVWNCGSGKLCRS